MNPDSSTALHSACLYHTNILQPFQHDHFRNAPDHEVLEDRDGALFTAEYPVSSTEHERMNEESRGSSLWLLPVAHTQAPTIGSVKFAPWYHRRGIQYLGNS